MADEMMYDAVILEWKQFQNITVSATTTITKKTALNNQTDLLSLSTNTIKCGGQWKIYRKKVSYTIWDIKS
jgi:hypothetical protein